MSRSNLILAGLFATGGAAVLVYTYLVHGAPGGSVDAPSPAAAAVADESTVVAPLSQSPAIVEEEAAAPPQDAEPDVIDLERQLKGGDLQALQSLREIALRDGDENGRIREVIRQAIAHGDSEDEMTREAQRVLDEIEANVPN